MVTMTRPTAAVPARQRTVPVRPTPVSLRLQRCAGVPCAARNCHDFGQLPVHPDAEATHSMDAIHVLGRQAAMEPNTIQATLTVGVPGDRYEQEADRVAEMIVGIPSPRVEAREMVSSLQISRIQRTCTACQEESAEENQEVLQRSADGRGGLHVSRRVQSQIDRLRGGGQPLADSVRAYFEPRFGYDFGSVRIHTDAVAATVARSLSARAFTVGTDVAFGAGEYSPEATGGKSLLAHELTHVVQQGGAAPRPAVSEVVQRAGDPAAIPPGLRCPADLTRGHPAGTDLLFSVGEATITPAHTRDLTAFVTAWATGGGTDDIVVHGYASTQGDQGPNWTLSCNRAEAVQAELVRLGVPAVRISVLAHGESSDFSPSTGPNQRAVVTTRAGGIFPLVSGVLTARDNFAGRGRTRFGVGEVIDLSFFSFPASPAAGLGGLTWNLVSGGGTLTAVTLVGTATYTAPATAGAVLLELRVASGVTAGRLISSHPITIVTPNKVNITEVPGTSPNFSPAGPIPPDTWGAGFQGNVFVDPKDVSFRGVLFGEGSVTSVVTGSFFAPKVGIVHPTNTFGFAHAGNVVTGTPVSPPRDNISSTLGPIPTVPPFGIRLCGNADFLWAIPWEFSVAGGPRTFFATANHHVTSTLLCAASIEKAGAGPFVRTI